MKSLNWPQIAACLAAGVVGGIFVPMLLPITAIWGRLATITAGEWLQAGAAIIGVALTVWATLWLEDQKRKREQLEEQRLIREALALLKSVLPGASQAVNAEWDLPKRILMTQAHYEMVRTGLESVSYARQGYRIRSYNLWNALTAIDIVHAPVRARLISEENIVRGNNVTDAVLAICREKIEEFATDLTAPVDAAVQALAQERV